MLALNLIRLIRLIAHCKSRIHCTAVASRNIWWHHGILPAAHDPQHIFRVLKQKDSTHWSGRDVSSLKSKHFGPTKPPASTKTKIWSWNTRAFRQFSHTSTGSIFFRLGRCGALGECGIKSTLTCHCCWGQSTGVLVAFSTVWKLSLKSFRRLTETKEPYLMAKFHSQHGKFLRAPYEYRCVQMVFGERARET